MKTRLIPGLILAVFSFAAIQAQTPPPEPILKFPEGVTSVRIPIEIFENIPYVPLRIPSLGRELRFILDTGAGGIVAVDESVAREAGMPLSGEFPLGGAGENRKMGHIIEKGRFETGGLSFEGGTQITIPLHDMDPFWGKRKDGLIGGTWISRTVMVLDYRKSELTFHRPESFAWPADGHTIPLIVDAHFAFVEVNVHLHGLAAPVKALMMLDTGLRGTTFNNPFSKEHDLAGHSPKRLETVTGYGIGGVSRGIFGRVRALEIGAVRIEEPVVAFATDKSGALADPGYAGIIGTEILHRFTVTLDYAGGRMNLRKNDAFGEPSEYDMSGLWFRCEGPDFRTFVVQNVAPGTPAATAGLAVEDRLLAIDGRDAGEFSLESLRRYLKQAGKTVNLTVRRGTEKRQVNIKLERIV